MFSSSDGFAFHLIGDIGNDVEDRIGGAGLSVEDGRREDGVDVENRRGGTGLSVEDRRREDGVDVEDRRGEDGDDVEEGRREAGNSFSKTSFLKTQSY